MAPLSSRVSRRHSRLQYPVQRNDVNPAPTYHGKVGHLHLAKPVLAAQFNAALEVVVGGFHAALEIVGVSQSA